MSPLKGITVAIDTSGSFCSIAMRDAVNRVVAQSSAGSGDHFEQLPRMLERVCRDAGVEPAAIGEIRIGVGPGSFTGLRIGMSFAKGLAWSLQANLIGCSSFAGVAAATFARESAAQRVVVVADARRDELFAAVYERGDPVTEMVAPCIVPLSELSSPPWRGAGAVWVCSQRDFTVTGLQIGPEHDTAKGLLALPVQTRDGCSIQEIAILEPTYLRAVAAKTIEERKLGT